MAVYLQAGVAEYAPCLRGIRRVDVEVETAHALALVNEIVELQASGRVELLVDVKHRQVCVDRAFDGRCGDGHT